MRVKKIELECGNDLITFDFSITPTETTPGLFELLKDFLTSCYSGIITGSLCGLIPPGDLFFMRIYFEDDTFSDYGFSEKELIYKIGKLNLGYALVNYNTEYVLIHGLNNTGGNSLLSDFYTRDTIDYVNNTLKNHSSFSDVSLINNREVVESAQNLPIYMMGEGYMCAVRLLIYFHILSKEKNNDGSLLLLKENLFNKFDRELSNIILSEANLYGISIIMPSLY